MLGLIGEQPASAIPDRCEATPLDEVERTGLLNSPRSTRNLVRFVGKTYDFHQRESLPRHTNGMRLTATSAGGTTLVAKDFYSIGGGFVVSEDDWLSFEAEKQSVEVPLPFDSAQTLLARCCAKETIGLRTGVTKRNSLAISQENPSRVKKDLEHDGVLHP
jgi:L-serine dehydratase